MCLWGGGGGLKDEKTLYPRQINTVVCMAKRIFHLQTVENTVFFSESVLSKLCYSRPFFVCSFSSTFSIINICHAPSQVLVSLSKITSCTFKVLLLESWYNRNTCFCYRTGGLLLTILLTAVVIPGLALSYSRLQFCKDFKYQLNSY